MTTQHRATPEQWRSVAMQGHSNIYACLLELRDRIEALEAFDHHPLLAAVRAQSKTVAHLGNRVERLEELHAAVADLNQRFSLDPLVDRIEALEATQHAHIAAAALRSSAAAEAGARYTMEQLRSQPGSWQPLKVETTYGEASDHAQRMVRDVGSAPETVEGSFEMGGKSYIYKAYSEPAAEPSASQFTAKHLFTSCDIVQDSFCYDPDGSSVWFETEISHPVIPGDNIKIAHHWGEAPDSKCCSTINYKVLSTSETEIKSLRVRAARVDASDSAPATAADARQLTLVERICVEAGIHNPADARGAIREVAAAALQMHPDPNLTWERVTLWLEQEANR